MKCLFIVIARFSVCEAMTAENEEDLRERLGSELTKLAEKPESEAVEAEGEDTAAVQTKAGDYRYYRWFEVCSMGLRSLLMRLL